MVEKGLINFEATENVNGRSVGQVAHRRCGGSVDIINHESLAVSEFESIGLLRSCKRINEEASQILYCENCFVFDTR